MPTLAIPTLVLRLVVLVLCLGFALPEDAEGKSRRRQADNGMLAVLDSRANISLQAEPLRGEGLYAFTRRMTGTTRHSGAISRLNGRPQRLLSGRRYAVPYSLLRPELKVVAIQALFPKDAPEPSGWRHTVDAPRIPSLWQVSEWFTGTGQNFAKIRSDNRLRDDSLRIGQTLLIDKALLLPVFAAALPEPPPPPPPTPPPDPPSAGAPASGAPPSGEAGDEPLVPDVELDLDYPLPATDEFPDLDYWEDAEGQRFAVYRLKPGEALYSAVVVRFVGAIFAESVNQIAAELAELNGIRDVRDMPVGQEIRVPFDSLLPQYLPAADPRRKAYEAGRSASEQYSNTVQASLLEGVTVILDAGHGGHDPGVTPKGVWESVYVYDIMARAKRLLETRTAARVVPTTRNGRGSNPYAVPNRDVLPQSRKHEVVTTPPYLITDARVGANLRWYLANSQHRKAVERSGDDAKTVFLSIHADSLPPTHRGMMAYVPAASLTRGEYGKSGKEYDRRQEVKEKRRVSFSYKERTRSEGLSRDLAKQLQKSFERHDLRVHTDKPIRDRVIRCRRCRPWVPAVVRYNAVPAKLLLEVCNLNNAQDRKLLQTQAFREKVALAIVDGILAYYGQTPLGGDSGRDGR